MNLAKIGEIAFRRVESELSGETYYEIVKWQGQTCFTIIQCEETREGFDLKFVGERPFEEVKNENISLEDLWALMQYAQTFLDNEFEFAQHIKER